MNQSSEKWLVLGYDSFEACSDPEQAQRAWYKIGEFESEADAISCAWRQLRRGKKAATLEDHIHIVDPEGTNQRCVIRYCRSCQQLDSMEPTGRVKRGGFRALFRPREWEYACQSCGDRDWRARNQVFLFGKISDGASDEFDDATR